MSATDKQEDTAVYKVLVNHEEQYSLWLADLEVPNGWRETGTSGSKDECIAYVNQVWTDMRPLSLRQQMANQASPDAATPPS